MVLAALKFLLSCYAVVPEAPEVARAARVRTQAAMNHQGLHICT